MSTHLPDRRSPGPLEVLSTLDWTSQPAEAVAGGDDWGAYEGLPPRIELLDDGRKARLLSPLSYRRPDGSDWPAPAGSELDGASIPRVFWSLIGGPFEGRYRNASIVHDRYCDTRSRTWESTHRMFYEAMRCSGVDAVQAKIMYYAVYRFGPRWPAPGEESLETGRPARSLGGAAEAELAADAAAIEVHDLRLEEIEALADARDAVAREEAADDPGDVLRRARLLVVPGGSGGTDDLEAVAGEVALLPGFVMHRFEARGVRVVACRERITDFEAELRGVTPRGWEGTGRTWDDVPGVYLDEKKRVVIATIDEAGRRVVPTRASGLHGSASLTVHECLHGYDYAGGHAVLAEPAFLSARTADLARLDAYELQAGRPGLEETFAESGARFFVGPADTQPPWPHLIAFWRDEAAALSAQLPEAPEGEAEDEGAAHPLGTAELTPEGHIVLDLRAEGAGGAIGHARLHLRPDDPAHGALRRRLFGGDDGLESLQPRITPFTPAAPGEADGAGRSPRT